VSEQPANSTRTVASRLCPIISFSMAAGRLFQKHHTV
jgi:hypothetical protein